MQDTGTPEHIKPPVYQSKFSHFSRTTLVTTFSMYSSVVVEIFSTPDYVTVVIMYALLLFINFSVK